MSRRRPKLYEPHRWCRKRGCGRRCLAPHDLCQDHRPAGPKRLWKRGYKRPKPKSLTPGRRSAGLPVIYEGI